MAGPTHPACQLLLAVGELYSDLDAALVVALTPESQRQHPPNPRACRLLCPPFPPRLGEPVAGWAERLTL